uniref:hypothetical protein n=1 Tax=Clostridioides difficile TaxID=1496 RepID=UPI001A920CEE
FFHIYIPHCEFKKQYSVGYLKCYYDEFTYHLVNIKREETPVRTEKLKKFTYHLVNIKPLFGEYVEKMLNEFTYHLVNIKPQNKLSIFSTYTHTTLSNLQ